MTSIATSDELKHRKQKLASRSRACPPDPLPRTFSSSWWLRVGVFAYPAYRPGTPGATTFLSPLSGTFNYGWDSFARATIDAGADIYVSHGEPTLKGVEVYHGGLILYGLGNFIFHTKTDVGRYPPDVWQSVIVEVAFGSEGAEEVTFTPVVLDEGTEGPGFFETRGIPEVAEGQLGQGILRRLIDLSDPYGTKIELRDGSATLTIAGL